jgi:hypothetical protein
MHANHCRSTHDPEKLLVRFLAIMERVVHHGGSLSSKQAAQATALLDTATSILGAARTAVLLGVRRMLDADAPLAQFLFIAGWSIEFVQELVDTDGAGQGEEEEGGLVVDTHPRAHVGGKFITTAAYTRASARLSSYIWVKSGAQHYVCQVQQFFCCSYRNMHRLLLTSVLRFAVDITHPVVFDPAADSVSGIIGERTFITADPPDWDAEQWLIPVDMLREPTGGLLCSCKGRVEGASVMIFTGPRVTSAV